MIRQAAAPVQPHSGCVDLRHSFAEIHNWLRKKQERSLQTAQGTDFEARSSAAKDGRPVIRFFQNGKEYGRSYSCCWGHYTNCAKTWIGMYCKALDDEFRTGALR